MVAIRTSLMPAEREPAASASTQHGVAAQALPQGPLQRWVAGSPRLVAQRRQLDALAGPAATQRAFFTGVRQSSGPQPQPAPGKTIQRALRPIEDAEPDNLERTVLGYIDLLTYRKARQEWQESDARTIAFKKLRLQAEAKEWKEAFDTLKKLEALVAEGDKTASTAQGPVALSLEEQRHLRELAKGDFQAAHDVLMALSRNQEVLRAVFGDNESDLFNARLNMIAIALQLLTYQVNDRVRTDDTGEAEAAGSLAHNVDRGKGAASTLMLTRAYAKASDHERIGTLIHEASHGSPITETADIVYLRSWAGMAVRGKVALMNADSYKKAALIGQGKSTALKPLAGGGERRGRVEQMLGWTDFRISQARSMASRLRQEAQAKKDSPFHAQPFKNVVYNSPKLYELSKALKLPWQEGRDPSARRERYTSCQIKNLDLDLFDMFVNAFGVALGYLDLIDEIDLREDTKSGLTFGRKLLVTSAALDTKTNTQLGTYLVAQIGARLPVPQHWKDAFHGLVVDLSTDRIHEEGGAMKELDATLS